MFNTVQQPAHFLRSWNSSDQGIYVISKLDKTVDIDKNDNHPNREADEDTR